jgi:hypothetical protein
MGSWIDALDQSTMTYKKYGTLLYKNSMTTSPTPNYNKEPD